MNKLLLITVLLVLITDSLQSQTKFGGSLSFSQSRNLAKQQFDKSPSSEGFSIGLFAEICLSDRFIFQPEINYLGYIEESEQISIPILAKYKLSKKFHVFAGPSLGIMLGQNLTEDSVYFGLSTGIEYEINKRFSIDARYNFGLTKLEYTTNNGLDNLEPFRLHTFQIGIKYKF